MSVKMYGCDQCGAEWECEESKFDGCCPMCHEHHGTFCFDDEDDLHENMLSINDLKTFYLTSNSIDRKKYPNFFAWYDDMVKTGKYHNESVEESIGSDLSKYQEWVDYDMKHYGKISKKTQDLVNKAGLEIVKDRHGDYEVIAKELKEDTQISLDGWSSEFNNELERDEYTLGDPKGAHGFIHSQISDDDVGTRYVAYFYLGDVIKKRKTFTDIDSAKEWVKGFILKEDTVKKRNGKWTNRGDDGTEHGEFKTKKAADAQRKAMFAQGYKVESLIEKIDNTVKQELVDLLNSLSELNDEYRLYPQKDVRDNIIELGDKLDTWIAKNLDSNDTDVVNKITKDELQRMGVNVDDLSMYMDFDNLNDIYEALYFMDAEYLNNIKTYADEALELPEKETDVNAISIVDLIKKAYLEGKFDKLDCAGRENAIDIDLHGLDKDRIVGFFDKQPEFNREDHNDSGINSVEFISDKFDIEIFDSFMRVYKIPQDESFDANTSESFKFEANKLFNKLKPYGAKDIIDNIDVITITFDKDITGDDTTLIYELIKSIPKYIKVATYGIDPYVIEFASDTSASICVKLIHYIENQEITVEVSKNEILECLNNQLIESDSDLDSVDFKIIKIISNVYKEIGEIESETAINEIEKRLSDSKISVDSDYLADMIIKSQEMINAGIN